VSRYAPRVVDLADGFVLLLILGIAAGAGWGGTTVIYRSLNGAFEDERVARMATAGAWLVLWLAIATGTYLAVRHYVPEALEDGSGP
jgi:hypothetical protein